MKKMRLLILGFLLSSPCVAQAQFRESLPHHEISMREFFSLPAPDHVRLFFDDTANFRENFDSAALGVGLLSLGRDGFWDDLVRTSLNRDIVRFVQCSTQAIGQSVDELNNQTYPTFLRSIQEQIRGETIYGEAFFAVWSRICDVVQLDTLLDRSIPFYDSSLICSEVVSNGTWRVSRSLVSIENGMPIVRTLLQSRNDNHAIEFAITGSSMGLRGGTYRVWRLGTAEARIAGNSSVNLSANDRPLFRQDRPMVRFSDCMVYFEYAFGFPESLALTGSFRLSETITITTSTGESDTVSTEIPILEVRSFQSLLMEGHEALAERAASDECRAETDW